MSKQRTQRVAERIKVEVSDILRLEIKDPGLYKMTSVTGVEMSRDLGYAKIYVSVFGDNDEQENILKLLTKASGFIRLELGKRIRLRHVPEVEFRLDRSLEYGAHINEVLQTLNPALGDDKKK